MVVYLVVIGCQTTIWRSSIFWSQRSTPVVSLFCRGSEGPPEREGEEGEGGGGGGGEGRGRGDDEYEQGEMNG